MLVGKRHEVGNKQLKERKTRMSILNIFSISSSQLHRRHDQNSFTFHFILLSLGGYKNYL